MPRRKYLQVFKDVPIPIDYASTQTYALLSKRDGGKTYSTLRLLEQMCDAGLFFVSLDPVGKHWSLRAGPDGTEQGGKPDVWVLGGQHGDVPLEPDSGELIADVVVEHPGQYVLDVSTFETDADQDRFALAFAKRLFRRKARGKRFPLLLVLEEAESFIPERPRPGQAAMLGAFGRVMRQGRNHGLGMWMVAQRAQALNKGVLSQAEVLVVKQMAHKRDRDAVDDWVKANGTPEQREQLMSSVASLEQNEAWVWSPSWLRTFERTTVNRRETYDASRSVASGELEPDVELVPLDVEALGKQMEQVKERKKAEDPKELTKRIRELERDAEKACQRAYSEGYEKGEDVGRTSVDAEIKEVPALNEGEIETVEAAVKMVDQAATEIAGSVAELQNALDMARELRQGVDQAPRPLSPTPVAPTVESMKPYEPLKQPKTNRATSNGNLNGVAREILSVLASFPHGLTRQQISLLTGRKPRGGSWYTAMKQVEPYVLESGNQLVINNAGQKLVPESVVLDKQEIIDRWRRSLPVPAREMLDLLLQHPNDEISLEWLAKQTGRTPKGGSWYTAVKALRESSIVDSVGRDTLRLSGDVYDLT